MLHRIYIYVYIHVYIDTELCIVREYT